MVIKIIRIIVAGVIGAILWYAIKLLLVALGAPAIVGTFVLILALCAVAWFIASEFGLLGPGPPKL